LAKRKTDAKRIIAAPPLLYRNFFRPAGSK
jgi:hypothetical protein